MTPCDSGSGGVGSKRVGLKATTIRVSPDLWELLEAEAARQEVSVAQFVRDAALLRIGYLAGTWRPSAAHDRGGARGAGQR